MYVSWTPNRGLYTFLKHSFSHIRTLYPLNYQTGKGRNIEGIFGYSQKLGRCLSLDPCYKTCSGTSHLKIIPDGAPHRLSYSVEIQNDRPWFWGRTSFILETHYDSPSNACYNQRHKNRQLALNSHSGSQNTRSCVGYLCRSIHSLSREWHASRDEILLDRVTHSEPPICQVPVSASEQLYLLNQNGKCSKIW